MRFFRWIALGFGTGLLPKAPGTWGAILGVLFFWGMAGLELYLQLALTAALAALGAYGAEKTSKALGQKDPKVVVIDEIAGQMVAFLGHQPKVVTLLAGFLLFRLFDILKPPPVKQAEKLSGGVGIMADDLVAGVLANLCLWLLSPILPS